MYTILTLLVLFILLRQMSTVAMIWKVNGLVVIPHFAVLILLLLFASCSKEEVTTPTCINNDCSAQFSLPGQIDSNGFYHIDLDWTGDHYPRFTIDVDATITDPWYWYNNIPAVQANFYTETTWQFEHDILPIVQGARVNLRKYSDTRASGKRIVGPFPPEMQGDTIEISSRIWWEAGMATKYKDFSLKFIVE